MVVDPSAVKNRKYRPEELPEGATREQRIAALAEVLLERGLATNLAAAKRLAEGMVDTERKVMGQSSRPSDFSKERASFQHADSPLFRAVGGVADLTLPDGLAAFVDRARRKSVRAPQAPVEQPRPVHVPVEKPSQVMFAESPQRSEIRTQERRASVDPEPYAKTQLEASPDGAIVRHVISREHEDISIEEGIVAVPDAPPKEEPAKKDLAKDQGVDLFDIFNANK